MAILLRHSTSTANDKDMIVLDFPYQSLALDELRPTDSRKAQLWSIASNQLLPRPNRDTTLLGFVP